MYTVIYYKFGSKWYLDFPEYLENGGKEEDLERIGAFHDFLELAAAGETTVYFQMSVTAFEGAEEARLVGLSGEGSGAYYKCSTLEGQQIDLELWFNILLISGQGNPPAVIYYKKLKLISK